MLKLYQLTSFVVLFFLLKQLFKRRADDTSSGKSQDLVVDAGKFPASGPIIYTVLTAM